MYTVVVGSDRKIKTTNFSWANSLARKYRTQGNRVLILIKEE